ncbi:uncharacterized protein LOC127180332 [Labeo rohita]|uniref:uncharacterized protein LOC127180332 n=1 Tax=Labeo rohita TaxID=84645 RepID=UPI0021E30D8B|nr:uncharacterized protein LOC127180332 [Labeo rohita]
MEPMWFLKTLQELMLIFFDELVRTSKVSFKILDCDTADNVPQAETDFSEPSCPELSFSSVKSESSDSTVIPRSSKALIHDPDKSSLILDYFPLFLDTPGLIDQDFTMLFGEDISRWDSDVAAILLLLHLLPPTVKGRKTGKISATEAADHVVKFMKVGTSIKAFLERVGSTQPFLLCVGGKRSSIQKFYIILDQKAIPRMVQTAVAAFDELFKAHFVFAVSYDEALCNFYTFI